MDCVIHQDGSFDILGTHICLKNCYPGAEGLPLRPVCVEVLENNILYTLPGGKVVLEFVRADGRIGINCSGSGMFSFHDAAPIVSCRIENARELYAQGFGMEGPSGTFPIESDACTSHGLTALFGEKETVLFYAEDHTRYSTSFHFRQMKTLTGHTASLEANINLEGTADSEWSLPSLWIEEAAGKEEALRQCARRIASAMHARTSMPPAFFWSSWYYAYETMDQETLKEITEGIRREKVPFQYLELDAGYTVSLGDWLTPNHRWPEGLSGAARIILEAGLLPGIWVAPFIVGDRSKLFRDHPDWILRDLSGQPVVRLRSYTEPKIWGNPDCDYYVLDASHPDALSYIHDVFQTLRTWGFSLFKTDFMLWNMYDSALVRRYNPKLTSVEIMRSVLAAIRDAIGEESYLLGCIAPFMPFIGYADGMRLAGDCGAQWKEAYGPVNMLRELPCDGYFNQIFWQNDPDAMLIRDFDTMLDPEEVWSLTLLQALSGGIVSTSDPVHRLGEERRRLLRLVEPHGKVSPQVISFGNGGRELVLVHHLQQGDIVFVMNPADEAQTVVIRFAELAADPAGKYISRLDRTGKLTPVKEEVLAESLDGHHSLLFFVSGARLKEAPENLWIW